MTRLTRRLPIGPLEDYLTFNHAKRGVLDHAGVAAGEAVDPSLLHTRDVAELLGPARGVTVESFRRMLQRWRDEESIPIESAEFIADWYGRLPVEIWPDYYEILAATAHHYDDEAWADALDPCEDEALVDVAEDRVCWFLVEDGDGDERGENP